MMKSEGSSVFAECAGMEVAFFRVAVFEAELLPRRRRLKLRYEEPDYS